MSSAGRGLFCFLSMIFFHLALCHPFKNIVTPCLGPKHQCLQPVIRSIRLGVKDWTATLMAVAILFSVAMGRFSVTMSIRLKHFPIQQTMILGSTQEFFFEINRPLARRKLRRVVVMMVRRSGSMEQDNVIQIM